MMNSLPGSTKYSPGQKKMAETSSFLPPPVATVGGASVADRKMESQLSSQIVIFPSASPQITNS